MKYSFPLHEGTGVIHFTIINSFSSENNPHKFISICWIYLGHKSDQRIYESLKSGQEDAFFAESFSLFFCIWYYEWD